MLDGVNLSGPSLLILATVTRWVRVRVDLLLVFISVTVRQYMVGPGLVLSVRSDGVCSGVTVYRP